MSREMMGKERIWSKAMEQRKWSVWGGSEIKQKWRSHWKTNLDRKTETENLEWLTPTVHLGVNESVDGCLYHLHWLSHRSWKQERLVNWQEAECATLRGSEAHWGVSCPGRTVGVDWKRTPRSRDPSPPCEPTHQSFPNGDQWTAGLDPLRRAPTIGFSAQVLSPEICGWASVHLPLIVSHFLPPSQSIHLSTVHYYLSIYLLSLLLFSH